MESTSHARLPTKRVFEDSGVEETIEDEWDSNDPHQIKFQSPNQPSKPSFNETNM